MNTTCVLCDSPAVEGDPLHLCRAHGGIPGSWAWAHETPSPEPRFDRFARAFEDAA